MNKTNKPIGHGGGSGAANLRVDTMACWWTYLYMSEIVHAKSAELHKRYCDAICISVDASKAQKLHALSADGKLCLNEIQGIYFKVAERVVDDHVLPIFKMQDDGAPRYLYRDDIYV